MEKYQLMSVLKEIDALNSLKDKKNQLEYLISKLQQESYQLVDYQWESGEDKIDKEVLLGYLNTLQSQNTMERFEFYYKRLIKALTEIKTTPYNDINLNRWKEYEDILLDSLWLIKERDKSGVHSGDYWGNFVPQIPNQLLKRYTKKGEWVLDPFMGSGTTLIEAARLGRNSIGIELQPSVAKMAKERMAQEEKGNYQQEVVIGDSQQINMVSILHELGIEKVQFVLMHPPYWDIIKFSDDLEDLSNKKTLEGFLTAFGQVMDNTLEVLEKNRFAAVVIGDKYADGQWIPLGFYVMQEFLKRGCQLKSIIVKNFEETKGKRNQKNLWKYRALAGGFFLFKHEYIFLFKKLSG